jgi:hypothetical protein
MSTEYDSNFIAQVSQVSKRTAAQQPAPADDADPTFRYRRNLANISEAVMMRVVELEREAASLIEIAKKLRAAVVANT